MKAYVLLVEVKTLDKGLESKAHQGLDSSAGSFNRTTNLFTGNAARKVFELIKLIIKVVPTAIFFSRKFLHFALVKGAKMSAFSISVFSVPMKDKFLQFTLGGCDCDLTVM